MGQVLRAVPSPPQGEASYQLRGMIGGSGSSCWSSGPPRSRERGHAFGSGEDLNLIISSVTRACKASDEMHISSGQGLKVLWWAWREGGREGWRYGFLSGLGQLLQEAEIHREATYYYRLMQQQENSLFDNLLGINLFSQRHCYMIIIFVEILLNFLVYSLPFLHKYVFVKSKPNLYFDNSCLSSIFTFLCKTKMKL
mgnify:CR=1 FL=1